MRLACRADGPTFRLVGLVQVPGYDIGIGDVGERNPVGVFDQSYRHLRATQIIAESAGVLLLLPLVQRDRGTPQGSSISPLLANLFLHYAFDVWMGKQFPDLQFERYCDDGVVHCKTEKQAQFVRDAIAGRLAQCGLELHPDKTRIVYCKDADRRATYANERFDFLGYTFRPRLAKSKTGRYFASFSPAASNDAVKEMGRELRSWRLNCRSDKSLGDLAHMFNKVVQGWINYYGRFYKSRLYPLLRRINEYLVRWAKRKYKRLRGHSRRARRWLVRVARREPTLFAHWRIVRPDGWTMGAG